VSKVQVTLEAPIRDFIVDTLQCILDEATIKRLQKARIDKLGYIKCMINPFELEQMIGDLCFEGNHTEDREVQRMAYYAAEVLEIYSR